MCKKFHFGGNFREIITGCPTVTLKRTVIMDNVKISSCILVMAFPASAVFAFILVGLMKFLCQLLKIQFRKPYALGKLRFRLLTSIVESVFMALIINIVKAMAQVILAIPIIWQQWLWATSMIWILWCIGTFVGKSIAVWVFGKNICNNAMEN